MILRDHLSKFLISIFITAGCIITSELHGTIKYSITLSYRQSDGNPVPMGFYSSSGELDYLNLSLKKALTSGDFSASKIIVGRILQKIGENRIDEKALAEAYYFIGVYYSFAKNDPESSRYLHLCISLKEKNKEIDDLYARALHNLGVIYKRSGDYKSLEDYSIRSLEVEKLLYGDSSPSLIGTYLSLAIASIDLQEYEKAINYSNFALTIGNNWPDSVSPLIMADLYGNMGVCYNRLADFSKAKMYFDKCESIYKTSHLEINDNYINLLNSLAATYRTLGLTEESNEFYELGIDKAISNNSALAFNLINSYAQILGSSGKKQKGDALLSAALARAKARFGETSHNYFEVLGNYAAYLYDYKIDNKRSLQYYKKCIDYLGRNGQDIFLKNLVITGYSRLLAETGHTGEALRLVQSLLFASTDLTISGDQFENPSVDLIKPDKTSLSLLKAKYTILLELYRKSQDKKILEAASQTSELLISLLEKIRINISEEESRLLLGDQYKDAYLNSVHDFNLLYSQTHKVQYLKKAFEYSERSKVAGLLTSARELKATQFHIPAAIADIEMRLQREISLYNARLTTESIAGNSDTALINKWKENLLSSTRSRDSLVNVFEKQYPGYFAIKYNTKVASLNDIPDIIGRSVNYLNYIVSDTLLYIFIVNRKHQELLAIPVDSAFFENVRQFRALLSMPSSSGDAKAAFEMFKLTGMELKKTLVDPVKNYLISNNLLIAPDNILAYLPFETIPAGVESIGKVMYNNIDYLMDEFDISYTYSATFMSESLQKAVSSSNKLIVFAPNYSQPIDIQSVLMSRDGSMGTLSDLPYARQESEFVADLTGGKLYINDDARESIYKKEAGKFDIIHLAMHTLLNDNAPMHSTLIFSQRKDSIEDGLLKTYEVYGIPLKAKMVVLSSCNTGTGLLSSGEGILSMARGFIYSGSQSVIMSMWEVEDKSGTEIVKMFYKNLKRGYSKSAALRKARILFLKNADQLHSHPYFWSTLVVYGDNSALYCSQYLILALILSFIIMTAVISAFYLKRKNS